MLLIRLFYCDISHYKRSIRLPHCSRHHPNTVVQHAKGIHKPPHSQHLTSLKTTLSPSAVSSVTAFPPDRPPSHSQTISDPPRMYFLNDGFPKWQSGGSVWTGRQPDRHPCLFSSDWHPPCLPFQCLFRIRL